MSIVMCGLLVWSLYRSPATDDGGSTTFEPTPMPMSFDISERLDDQRFAENVRQGLQNLDRETRESLFSNNPPHGATAPPIAQQFESGGDLDVDLDSVLADPADERGRIIP